MNADIKMCEKNYKAMTTIGAASISTGIIIIVTGVVCGIISIVNGARLLKSRSNILF